MSKEMIISVNGREKKIAILDNGRVTEFYIERGEENAGVVGNIYKGRVMRVLPGMQSAFVDIGLERDAFLYVSDFFDEEEEIERIVMEKGKKTSKDDADPEVTDHLQKERLKREKRMEDAQEIAEPLAESGIEIEDEEKIEEDEKPQEEPKDKRGRSRRGRKGKQKPESKEDKTKEAEEEKSRTANETEDEAEEYTPVFEFEESGFERVIDDEDTGDMFKDAYMQEAIFDKVRAVEFDMESTGTAEVGSFINSVSDEKNGFQRIADEDETEEAKPKKSGRTRSRRTKNKAVSETADESGTTDSAEDTETEKKPAQKSSTAKKSSRKKSAGDETAETEAKPKKSSRSRSRKSSAKSKKETTEETPADTEASVSESDSAAEMAVRRGGRGRRRGGRGPNDKTDDNVEKSDSGEDNSPENDSRTESKSGIRNNRTRSSSRRDTPQPTITDLLREGQEILVQIAKEPIARKGARITSHIALPGRHLVYMPTIEHLGVSRKIESAVERGRLRKIIQTIRQTEEIPSGGFIVRTAGTGVDEENLRQDARYLVRTWQDIKIEAEKSKSPALVHQDLDLIQRLLRDQMSDEFTAIRVDSEEEYLRIVEFINRIQPKMVKRVKLYTRDQPILEAFGVQDEIEKALKPRVWLKSGGYLVLNQTEALVAIDVNTGKFVGKGNARLEDTITKTNMEAVDEIARQIRLRDLGGIIVLDLIDMEDRRNRHKVQQALQEALSTDKSPNKVLSFNDFGLIIMTRKRVKQSLERTMCSPCEYCEGAGWVKSAQTVCYEILDEARRLSKTLDDVRRTTIRVHPEVARTMREEEKTVLEEIEDYLGDVDITSDKSVHQTQFDFAFI
ncbi:MAG: Rne/Rng family ribonuclease [Pyrinomonadaceae bacterium]